MFLKIIQDGLPSFSLQLQCILCFRFERLHNLYRLPRACKAIFTFGAWAVVSTVIAGSLHVTRVIPRSRCRFSVMKRNNSGAEFS